MPTPIIDVETFTSPIIVPVDGDPLNAASANTPFQALANRTYKVFRLLTAVAGAVLLDTPANVVRYIAGYSLDLGGINFPEVGWTKLSTGGFSTNTSGSPSQQTTIDLTPKLGQNEYVRRLRVLVIPGAVRAGGNRIVITLSSVEFGLNFASPTTPTKTDRGTASDDGTTNLQWITVDLTGAPPLVQSDQTWFVNVKMGNTCNTGGQSDFIYAAAIEVAVDRVGTN